MTLPGIEITVDGPSKPPVVRLWMGVMSFVDWPDRLKFLAPEERARACRFVFDRDRARYVCARDGLRRILGRLLQQEPATLDLYEGPHGRPLLRGRGMPFDFNLSHTGQLLFVACSNCGPVGVDVEAIRNTGDLEGMARLVMHATEWRSFEGMPHAERTKRFYALWTRKEALLKALGSGLQDDPRRWVSGFDSWTHHSVHGVPCTLWSIRAPAGHSAAVCVPEVAAWEWHEFESGDPLV